MYNLALVRNSRCLRKQQKERNIPIEDWAMIKRSEDKNERKGRLIRIYIHRWVTSDFP